MLSVFKQMGDCSHQFLFPFSGYSRNEMQIFLMSAKNFLYLRKTFVGDRQVSFGDDHELRTAGQGSIKSVKFTIDDAIVGIRITCWVRYIKKMHENRSPREMAQKAYTESMSGVRALNEPRHVSHDK